ncbi:hypothetical protein ACJX0J_015418, partial [Zea mays]
SLAAAVTGAGEWRSWTRATSWSPLCASGLRRRRHPIFFFKKNPKSDTASSFPSAICEAMKPPLERNPTKKRHSWWWDSHISPKNSKWLAENLE